MSYQPYLIANFATGVNSRLQPWLIPDEAQEELYDGYVYRGVMSKRSGYTYYATAERGGQPYCESRIVGKINAEPARTSGGVLVVGTGATGPYVFRAQNLPLRRGTVIITAGAQSAIDDGLGVFDTVPAGGTGTVDYTTGDISITFLNVVAGATPITITYSWHPGYPVLGIMNFVTSTNVKQLIVADGRRLNLYDSTLNILDFLGLTLTITAITQANPAAVTTSAAHNLTTGDKIFISSVLGMTQVNNLEFTIIVTGANTFTIGVNSIAYTAYTSGGQATLLWQGNITAPATNFYSWVNYADGTSNPRLLFTNNVGQIGYYAPHLANSVGDYVAYPTIAAPEFFMTTDAGAAVTTITCLQMFINKDRLLLLRTTENGTIRPMRIRISGTGASSDDFRTSATGAGFIDIPDGSWIQGAAFNRDDLVIFTERSTWVLKYTGNDTTPFVIKKIDESRGSEAPFGAITYLNRTSALSPRGLIITDGYRVERQDELIPDFSFNQIDGVNFPLCFAGSVDEDRDHYLIYPPPNENESQRILTTNYDEDNYSTYRIPLSCMGNFVVSFDITWADLSKYINWAAFAADYGNWNSFAYSAGAPVSIGGGHNGEIWRLNVNESEDNPVRIRNITIIDATTVEVTTDWNNYSMNATDPSKGADYIFITAVEGMLEINDDQYPILSVTDNYTFRIDVPSSTNFTAYTSGGTAMRVIPFSSLMKKFNPFVNEDKKVRCGWLYMYVDTTGTRLRRQIPILSVDLTDPCLITTADNHNLANGAQISIFGVVGTVEINDGVYTITVVDATSFTLDGIDATGFTPYVSGGYVSTAVNAAMAIDIITNDNVYNTQPMINGQIPYKGTCSNLIFETGAKKWYKVYINQVGRFVQFRFRNLQAGATINVQAVMPGFAPVGRMI